MTTILFKRFCFKALLLSFTVEYSQNLLCCTVDSNDDDEMGYLSESSGGEADWYFFSETTNCIKCHWTT